MSIVFMDGFDNYNSDALMIDRGWVSSNWGALYNETTGGRFNGPYPKCRYGTTLANSISTGLSGFVVSWAEKCDAGEPADGYEFFSAIENTTVHCTVRWRAGRKLQVYLDGSTSYVGSPSTWSFPQDEWLNVQVKVVIHDSTGSVVVQIDGYEIINETGLDTKNGGTGLVDVFKIRGLSGSNRYDHYDDFAVWSLTGDAPTGLIDDFRIETLRPNADSTPVNFTKSAGSNNYENVDDAFSNQDTDYNSNATIGEKDRLDLPSLTGTPDAIYAVQAVIHSKKSDAGARSAQVGVYSGSTEDLSSAQLQGTDYAFYTHIMTVNPDDSAAWEEADIDALEVQYETA